MGGACAQGTFAQLRVDLRPVKQQLTIVPDPGVPPMHPFGENEDEEMAASNAALPTAVKRVVRNPAPTTDSEKGLVGSHEGVERFLPSNHPGYCKTSDAIIPVEYHTVLSYKRLGVLTLRARWVILRACWVTAQRPQSSGRRGGDGGGTERAVALPNDDMARMLGQWDGSEAGTDTFKQLHHKTHPGVLVVSAFAHAKQV